MAMHEIELGRAERKIFLNSVDDLFMGGKPEKLNKVGHRNVYRTEKLEEN